MKKILITTIIITILLSITSCDNEVINTPTKYYSTGSVFSGSINIDNSVVWYIKWKDMINLSAKVGWRISNIYVKEWTHVKKWELLAKLDSLEAKVWYSSADNIVNSLVSLKKSTSMMFDKQISAMEQKVEQAKIWEKWVKDWLSDTIIITNAQLKTAKTWVETAKANLDHTKSVLDTKETHIYNNLKDAIVWSVILDTNIINFVDSVIWVTEANKHKNDTFEAYLSAKNSSYLRDTKTKFIEANKIFKDYKIFYDNEIDWKNPNKETILKWINDWTLLAEKLKSLLSSTYNVFDNSIENTYFTINTINSYKKSVSDFWNNLESSLLTVSWEYILWLKWSKQGLDDFDKSSQMQLDLLQKQLTLAENTLAQYQAMSEWQVREVSTKSQITSSQLNEAISWLEALKKQKETQLNEIQAKINEALWQRNSAWVMINNWEIRSPITWVITSKIAEVWQVVWWGMPILSISSEDNLKVNITVSEEQANNIKLWDKVLLEVSWLDKQVTWKITNIFPSRDLITKKIWIEISLVNTWNKIQIWSYTKIIFNNKSDKKGIIISNNAIISKFMIPWVYVLKKWIVQFKNIELIKQNDNFSEVKWLNIWDIIILDWKENIWDREVLK